MRFLTFTSALVALVASIGVIAQTANLTGPGPLVAGPTTGSLGNATVITNNPPGVVYTASLATVTQQTYGYHVQGEISATANPNGIGVLFHVAFRNLPPSGGPFLYHIHAAPVPADGNCTSTLAHLDPFNRGETPACDSKLPQTCQVGDLAGKHGQIISDPFVAAYTDDFASTVPGTSAYFGNLSFVVHFANKTRITCANFKVGPSTITGGNTSAPFPTGSATAIPTPFVGGASAVGLSTGLMLGTAGLLAFLI